MVASVTRIPYSITRVSQALDSRYKALRRNQTIGDAVTVTSYMIDDVFLKLDSFTPVVFVFSGYHRLQQSTREKLEETFSRHHLNIVILSSDAEIDADLRNLIKSYYVAVVRCNLPEGAGKSPEVLADILLKAFREQIPKLVLSPYQCDSVATGRAFFDRSDIIERALSSSSGSLLITGIRRIGKTSLLRKLEEVFENRGHIAAFVSANLYSDSKLLADTIVELIAPRRLRRYLRLQDLVRILRLTSKEKRLPVILLIDEAGPLIERERNSGWEFMNTLKAANAEGTVRTFIAASPAVLDESVSYQSPLFNFAERIALGPFGNDDAHNMIMNPMNTLGIKGVDALVPRIISESGGYPSFIQYYCDWIVRQSVDSSCKEQIDLERIYSDQGFKLHVLQTFVANTNPFEKAVVYTMCALSKHSNDVFTVDDLWDKTFRHEKVLRSDIESACTKLAFMGILGNQGRNYFLAVPALWNMIRIPHSTQALLQETRAMLRVQN